MSTKKTDPFKEGFSGGFLGGIIALALVLGFLFLMQGSIFPIVDTETMNVTVEGTDVAVIVEQVNPAVVSIVVTQDVPIIETYYEDPFGEFFDRRSPFGFSIPRYRENGTEEREIGAGSGFLISDNGFIVTNAHVVDAQDAYFTIFLNETSHEAELVAADQILDIAVLKIDGENFPFLEFGDSDQLKLGQGVIAIGNALGEFGNSISTGVVSGLARTIFASNGNGRPEELEDVIQTDAAINPGNSGGPLLDFAGQVIGINVAVATGSENIGFSIPSNVAFEAIEVLKEGKSIERPFLGVRYIRVDNGAQIAENGEDAVYPGSPADKAGLVVGDIITSVNGTRLSESEDLADVIRSFKVGDTIKLDILRDTEEFEVEVTLESLPS